MRLAGFCFVACSLIISSSAQAECRLDRAASLPLRLEQHPVVQASINGHLIPMLVDTGAQRSSITPETYSALGLERNSNRRARVNTVAGHEISQDAFIQTLKIGDLDFSERGVLVIPLGRSESGPDHRAGGVLGADLIDKFDIEFDFPRATMTLFRPSHCAMPPWTGPYLTIPIKVLPDRLVFFPVTLNDHRLTAVFDTGSQGETVLQTSAKRIGISDVELAGDPSANGTAAGQRYAIRRHRFQSFHIGDDTFHNITLDVADFNQAGVDMLVGLDYMRKRRFFLSYSTQALFVQRGSPDQSEVPQGTQAAGLDKRCPAPANLLPHLSPISPKAISRPNFPPPEPVQKEHIDGCAGVAFRLTAGGTPTDVKLIAERPTGYGIGDFAVHEIAATQFLPPGGSADQLYYEAHRYRPTQASQSPPN
jgi:predicted aspartyl protease